MSSRSDPCLAAEEPLGAEVLVRERAHETDTELAIELVQRRRAESIPDIAPHRHALGDAIERRDTRADHRVISILERPSIARAWKTGRDIVLEDVTVVVLPAVHSRAERQHDVVEADHVLQKEAVAVLRAAGVALQRERGRSGWRNDRGADVAIYASSRLSPST